MNDLRFDVIDLEGPKRYFSVLRADTMAHAYLFSGPPGVGKKSFARRLAQSLLCRHPKDGVLGYDGTCSSCILFSAGENARHPDFYEHNGAMKIGQQDAGTLVDGDELTARDVVRALSMQSYSGGMRVLLLGDVDFASPPAANALLKFLEEPPAGVVVLLTTATPGRLLTTIRSRLIEVRFPALATPVVREVLASLGYAESDAEKGAALGGGSVSAAIAALETDEETLRAQVARWFFESVRGQSPEQAWASRETLDEGLQMVKALVRDWAVLSQSGSKTGTDGLLMRDFADELSNLPALGDGATVDILAKIGDAQRLARTNVSAAMVGEIVRMAITGSAR